MQKEAKKPHQIRQKTDQHAPPQREVTPQQDVQQQQIQTHLLDGSAGLFGQGSIENQVHLLRDDSLQPYQGLMATEIDHRQGNQHLNEVVNQVNDSPTQTAPVQRSLAQRNGDSTAGNDATPQAPLAESADDLFGFAGDIGLLPGPPPDNNGNGAAIQPKLMVGDPDTPSETQADSIAQQILDSPPLFSPNGTQKKETEPPTEKPSPPDLSKLLDNLNSIIEEPPTDENQGTATNPQVESAVEQIEGKGTPLPDEVRLFFESRMGANFEDVRLVYQDDLGTDLSTIFNAHAWAWGRNIVFNDGEFDFTTDEGKSLLAHELTHIMQNGVAPPLDDFTAKTEGQSQAKSDETAEGEELNPTKALLIEQEMRARAAYRQTGEPNDGETAEGEELNPTKALLIEQEMRARAAHEQTETTSSDKPGQGSQQPGRPEDPAAQTTAPQSATGQHLPGLEDRFAHHTTQTEDDELPPEQHLPLGIPEEIGMQSALEMASPDEVRDVVHETTIEPPIVQDVVAEGFEPLAGGETALPVLTQADMLAQAQNKPTGPLAVPREGELGETPTLEATTYQHQSHASNQATGKGNTPPPTPQNQAQPGLPPRNQELTQTGPHPKMDSTATYRATELGQQRLAADHQVDLTLTQNQAVLHGQGGQFTFPALTEGGLLITQAEATDGDAPALDIPPQMEGLGEVAQAIAEEDIESNVEGKGRPVEDDPDALCHEEWEERKERLEKDWERLEKDKKKWDGDTNKQSQDAEKHVQENKQTEQKASDLANQAFDQRRKEQALNTKERAHKAKLANLTRKEKEADGEDPTLAMQRSQLEAKGQQLEGEATRLDQSKTERAQKAEETDTKIEQLKTKESKQEEKGEDLSDQEIKLDDREISLEEQEEALEKEIEAGCQKGDKGGGGGGGGGGGAPEPPVDEQSAFIDGLMAEVDQTMADAAAENATIMADFAALAATIQGDTQTAITDMIAQAEGEATAILDKAEQEAEAAKSQGEQDAQKAVQDAEDEAADAEDPDPIIAKGKAEAESIIKAMQNEVKQLIKAAQDSVKQLLQQTEQTIAQETGQAAVAQGNAAQDASQSTAEVTEGASTEAGDQATAAAGEYREMMMTYEEDLAVYEEEVVEEEAEEAEEFATEEDDPEEDTPTEENAAASSDSTAEDASSTDDTTTTIDEPTDSETSETGDIAEANGNIPGIDDMLPESGASTANLTTARNARLEGDENLTSPSTETLAEANGLEITHLPPSTDPSITGPTDSQGLYSSTDNSADFAITTTATYATTLTSDYTIPEVDVSQPESIQLPAVEGPNPLPPEPVIPEVANPELIEQTEAQISATIDQLDPAMPPEQEAGAILDSLQQIGIFKPEAPAVMDGWAVGMIDQETPTMSPEQISLMANALEGSTLEPSLQAEIIRQAAQFDEQAAQENIAGTMATPEFQNLPPTDQAGTLYETIQGAPNLQNLPASYQADLVLGSLQQLEAFQPQNPVIMDGWAAATIGAQEPTMNQEQINLLVDTLEGSNLDEAVQRDVIQEAAGVDLATTQETLTQTIATPEFSTLPPEDQANLLLETIQNTPNLEKLPLDEQALAAIELVQNMDVPPGMQAMTAMTMMQDLEAGVMTSVIEAVPTDIYQQTDMVALEQAQADMQALATIHQGLAPTLLEQFGGVTPENQQAFTASLNANLTNGLESLNELIAISSDPYMVDQSAQFHTLWAAGSNFGINDPASFEKVYDRIGGDPDQIPSEQALTGNLEHLSQQYGLTIPQNQYTDIAQTLSALGENETPGIMSNLGAGEAVGEATDVMADATSINYPGSTTPEAQASILLNSIQGLDAFKVIDPSTIQSSSVMWVTEELPIGAMTSDQIRLVAEAVEGVGVSEEVKTEVVRQAAGFETNTTETALNDLTTTPYFQSMPPTQQADMLLVNLQQTDGFDKLPPAEQAMAAAELFNQLETVPPDVQAMATMNMMSNIEQSVVGDVAQAVSQGNVDDLILANTDFDQLKNIHTALAETYTSQMSGINPGFVQEMLTQINTNFTNVEDAMNTLIPTVDWEKEKWFYTMNGGNLANASEVPGIQESMGKLITAFGTGDPALLQAIYPNGNAPMVGGLQLTASQLGLVDPNIMNMVLGQPGGLLAQGTYPPGEAQSGFTDVGANPLATFGVENYADLATLTGNDPSLLDPVYQAQIRAQIPEDVLNRFPDIPLDQLLIYQQNIDPVIKDQYPNLAPEDAFAMQDKLEQLRLAHPDLLTNNPNGSVADLYYYTQNVPPEWQQSVAGATEMPPDEIARLHRMYSNLPPEVAEQFPMDRAIAEGHDTAIYDLSTQIENAWFLQQHQKAEDLGLLDMDPDNPLTKVLQGALMGEFTPESEMSLEHVIGMTIIGFTPLGPIADVRDLIATISKYQTGEAEWYDIGLSIAAVIPGLDALKGYKAADTILDSNFYKYANHGAQATQLAGDVHSVGTMANTVLNDGELTDIDQFSLLMMGFSRGQELTHLVRASGAEHPGGPIETPDGRMPEERTMVNGDGSQTTLYHSPDGNVIAQETVRADRSVVQYPDGRTITQFNDGRVFERQTLPNGEVRVVTSSPTGQITTQMYSPDGQMRADATIIMADGKPNQVVETVYDQHGQVAGTQTTNFGENGQISHTQTVQFDSNGQPITTQTSNLYGPNGEMVGQTIATTDAQGNTQTQMVDSTGKPIETQGSETVQKDGQSVDTTVMETVQLPGGHEIKMTPQGYAVCSVCEIVGYTVKDVLNNLPVDVEKRDAIQKALGDPQDPESIPANQLDAVVTQGLPTIDGYKWEATRDPARGPQDYKLMGDNNVEVKDPIVADILDYPDGKWDAKKGAFTYTRTDGATVSYRPAHPLDPDPGVKVIEFQENGKSYTEVSLVNRDNEVFQSSMTTFEKNKETGAIEATKVENTDFNLENGSRVVSTLDPKTGQYTNITTTEVNNNGEAIHIHEITFDTEGNQVVTDRGLSPEAYEVIQQDPELAQLAETYNGGLLAVGGFEDRFETIMNTPESERAALLENLETDLALAQTFKDDMAKNENPQETRLAFEELLQLEKGSPEWHAKSNQIYETIAPNMSQLSHTDAVDLMEGTLLARFEYTDLPLEEHRAALQNSENMLEALTNFRQSSDELFIEDRNREPKLGDEWTEGFLNDVKDSTGVEVRIEDIEQIGPTLNSLAEMQQEGWPPEKMPELIASMKEQGLTYADEFERQFVTIMEGRTSQERTFAMNAFMQGGILPEHALGMQGLSGQLDVSFAFRGTPPSAGFWNMMGIAGKPGHWGFEDQMAYIGVGKATDPALLGRDTNLNMDTLTSQFGDKWQETLGGELGGAKVKSIRYGKLSGLIYHPDMGEVSTSYNPTGEPIAIRSDYDPGVFMYEGKPLNNDQANALVPFMDAAARGYLDLPPDKANQIMEEVMKIGGEDTEVAVDALIGILQEHATNPDGSPFTGIEEFREQILHGTHWTFLEKGVPKLDHPEDIFMITPDSYEFIIREQVAGWAKANDIPWFDKWNEKIKPEEYTGSATKMEDLSGTEIARMLNYPPSPDGYHWMQVEGNAYIRRTGGNGPEGEGPTLPKLQYDPTTDTFNYIEEKKVELSQEGHDIKFDRTTNEFITYDSEGNELSREAHTTAENGAPPPENLDPAQQAGLTVSPTEGDGVNINMTNGTAITLNSEGHPQITGQNLGEPSPGLTDGSLVYKNEQGKPVAIVNPDNSVTLFGENNNVVQVDPNGNVNRLPTAEETQQQNADLFTQPEFAGLGEKWQEVNAIADEATRVQRLQELQTDIEMAQTFGDQIVQYPALQARFDGLLQATPAAREALLNQLEPDLDMAQTYQNQLEGYGPLNEQFEALLTASPQSRETILQTLGPDLDMAQTFEAQLAGYEHLQGQFETLLTADSETRAEILETLQPDLRLAQTAEAHLEGNPELKIFIRTILELPPAERANFLISEQLSPEQLNILATSLNDLSSEEINTSGLADFAEEVGIEIIHEPSLEDWQEGDPLPKFTEAEIDPAKFERYSMDPDNPNNNGKWQAFEELGYDLSDPAAIQNSANNVMEQLNQALPDTQAAMGKNTPHGQRFEVPITITGPTGDTGTLITVWQYDGGSPTPRLITNWLKVHR